MSMKNLKTTAPHLSTIRSGRGRQPLPPAGGAENLKTRNCDMTKRSIFNAPKIVLVFNNQRVLISMYKSLNVASQAMNISAQSISLCCLGNRISCYGCYFRYYYSDKVEIVPHLDFGRLRVEEYDRMCGEVRRYRDSKELSRRKLSAEKRRKLKNEAKHE